MTFTIDIEANPLVGITDADVEAASDDRLAFTVEGTVRVTDELLGAFAGSQLTPRELELAPGNEPPVEIRLDDETGLRLDAVDVGVELPGDDADDAGEFAEGVVDGMAEAAGTDGPAPVDPTAPLDAAAGRVAFTVEGVVENVRDAAVERVAGDEVRPTAITFAVEDPLEGDGGSPGTPLAELELLGFRIALRANGTIVVTALAADAGIGPL